MTLMYLALGFENFESRASQLLIAAAGKSGCLSLDSPTSDWLDPLNPTLAAFKGVFTLSQQALFRLVKAFTEGHCFQSFALPALPFHSWIRRRPQSSVLSFNICSSPALSRSLSISKSQSPCSWVCRFLFRSDPLSI